MLDIYRASAGSGKTYRLTLEYVKMLLGRRDESGQYRFYKDVRNPHRRILAVTFTNKATDEMKQRIVKQLDILAHDTSRSDYCRELCKAFACDAARLQQVSRTVLYQLLHDFSYFNINTIDSFFQQVLRAFTREVGLQGGFDVEMDSAYVTAAAIDRLFADLENDADLLGWLLRYAEENIRDGGTWDIYGKGSGRSDIQELARHLTSERYKAYRRLLIEKGSDDFKSYIGVLRRLRKDFRTTLQAYAQNVLQAIDECGLVPTDFNYKWAARLTVFADVRSDFDTDCVTKFLNYAENPDKWLSKKKIKELNLDFSALQQRLASPLQTVIDCFGDPYVRYRTAEACLEHIYALGVLSRIDKNIAIYEQEHNTLLLSKTPEILSGIIDESDAPFIYEKIGTRIAHYMIDEFQDTSDLQWQNFAPLVNESLANANDNLIVGDVKQSIYRWRNSDWRLLHNEFDEKRSPLYSQHTMDTNWRSCANIVAFNNSFFKEASALLQRSLEEDVASSAIVAGSLDSPVVMSAYSDLVQCVSPSKKGDCGHVAFHLLDLAKKNKECFAEEVERRLPDLLKDLVSKGRRMQDIAILVRDNSDGKRIVELLLALAAEENSPLHGMKVISDEALLITNAPPVKLILGILRYLKNPEIAINELLLTYEYELMRMAAGKSESMALAAFFEHYHDKTAINPDLHSFIAQIESLPLFEMCEQIIAYFSRWGQMDNYVAYIEAFQDVVADYCRSHPADLHSFLLWWDAKEKRAREGKDSGLTIKSPDGLDAIRVLTIHKSKGLEFPVVIIPYANWTLNREGGLIWCAPDREPFNQMPVLPLTYRKNSLCDTYFAGQYMEERMNSYIDNLNLAYVAFTRAVEELIVFSPKPVKTQMVDMSDLIYQVVLSQDSVSDKEQFLFFPDYCKEKDGEICLEVGQQWMPEKHLGVEQSDPDIAYCVVPPEQRMQLRLKSRRSSGDNARDYGTLMHAILADIRYVQDVRAVVQRYVRDGVLRAAEAEATENRLRQWLSRPEVARWYSPDVRVLSETAILQSDAVFYRPDRVAIDGDYVTVIDYKLGNVERDNLYRKQVARYMALVRDMGYANVEGVIWYLALDRMVRV